MTSSTYTGADLIADFIAERCCGTAFLVTGGACAFIVDAIGRNPRTEFVCFQHEQAAAMAADARIDGARCTCNDVKEVLRVLGVEAARATLLNELISVVEWDNTRVSRRHVGLLCDSMSHSGEIALPPYRGRVVDRML